MRSTSVLTSTLLAASAISAVVASPQPVDPASPAAKRAGFSIPLKKRAEPKNLTTAQLHARARRQADALIAKYVKGPESRKRAGTASEPLTDFNVDLQYYGTVSVGTPAVDFDVILDTGSSDLWLAGKTCTSGCDTVTTPFDPTASSTFTDLNEPIDIQYGSGEVSGDIGTDTVTMQGFTITGQALGVMDTVSANVLQGALSGLMGLAWPDLAQTQANPWWLNAATNNLWTAPLFSFYLARYIDDASAQTVESSGGSMDIGFTNTDHYTGDINYIPLTGQNYWLIPLEGITINSKKLSPGGQAAIDTGTSLIGGPTADMANLYAQIPGAEAGTGDLEGYYVYPCSTSVTVSITFGGTAYSIESADFSRPADTSGTQCMGSFFGLDINNGVVEWIVGDTFLKNVYSVYRQSPAAVGFATVNSSGNGGGGGSSTTTSTGSGSTKTSKTSATNSGSSPTSSSGGGGGGSSSGAGVKVQVLGGGKGVSAMIGCAVMALVGGMFVL